MNSIQLLGHDILNLTCQCDLYPLTNVVATTPCLCCPRWLYWPRDPIGSVGLAVAGHPCATDPTLATEEEAREGAAEEVEL